jgi:murein DD-endopeptidase MepM/ murein hydrolase activator NlpD
MVMARFAFFRKLFRRDSTDDRTLMQKLRDKYRLLIINDETFEEVTSVKLTPLSVYVAVSMLIVGTATIVTLLIVYTPIKRYIPGYGDFRRDEEIAQLAGKVSSFERELEAKDFYIKNLQKIMNGDIEELTKKAVASETHPDAQADTLPKDVDRIPEDDQLRAQVATGSLFDAEPVRTTVSNTIGLRSDVPLEQLFFMPPVSGEITSAFDMQKNHFGIDIAAPKNTAIKATADGVVISAGYTVETGYSLAIQHPNNVVTLYKHNSVLLKKEGSAVKAGEAIAIIGNSGESSSGPHLHFELWHKGRAVDPSDYINFN